MNFNLKVDLRIVLMALVIASLALVGMGMLAPSGQTTINNQTPDCTVQQWNSQSAFGVTMIGDYKVVHLAVPPNTTGVHGSVQANDQWASFVAYCPGVPDIPLVATHLIGPPSRDYEVTVTKANGKLSVTAWEYDGWFNWKTPLIYK